MRVASSSFGALATIVQQIGDLGCSLRIPGHVADNSASHFFSSLSSVGRVSSTDWPNNWAEA